MFNRGWKHHLGLVVKPVLLHTAAGVEAIVPLQLIFHALLVLRIMLARRIRICAHAVERHIRDRERARFVEVHILDKAIGIEEIIALPSARQCRQGSGAEFHVDIFAAAENHERLVHGLKQGRDLSIACIAAPRACKRPRLADVLIVVGQITRSLAVELLGISAKSKLRRRQRQLRLANQLRRLGPVVDQGLVPIDLQIGGKPNTTRAWRQVCP